LELLVLESEGIN